MTDANARTGIRSILSGAYVPGIEEARELMAKLEGAHEGLAQEIVTQDEPLLSDEYEVPPCGTRVFVVDVPRHLDFLVRGVSILPRPFFSARGLVGIDWEGAHMWSQVPLEMLIAQLPLESGRHGKPWFRTTRRLRRGTRAVFDVSSHTDERLNLRFVVHGLRELRPL